METERQDSPAGPAPGLVNLGPTNVARLMGLVGAGTYDEAHAWSVRDREGYWALVIDRLGVRFREPPGRVLDLSDGVESPRWLPGARFNIAESCFSGPADAPAVVFQPEGGAVRTTSVGELLALTDRVASGLRRRGHQPGEPVAVIMPMTAAAVAIYLGIVKAGGVVVGIADSFRPKEIATRLRIAGAVAVFTQDVTPRGTKTLPLYQTVTEADAPPTVVVPAFDRVTVSLRPGDVGWETFLGPPGPFDAVPRDPHDRLNILFSSGTTGEPKAIPWTHTTPIKCAADAHFHQDVRPGDVVVWPTSLGWMMGPWLIFASLLNRAALGLYYGPPTGREFGRFVRDVRATQLGVVPTLVKGWRASGCMDGLDWGSLRLFSTTGECSTADDMTWLSGVAGGRPVIEYCGGTEVGGGYITGTVAKPWAAGTFNTPALGLDFVILDEDGRPAPAGEVFLVPPSIGLSAEVLNKDHHEVYHAGTPPGPSGEVLRRHGDRMERLPGGGWRALGRADDTMNLGGIKVSSVEIEQALRTVPGIDEAAAVGVSPGGGPSQLVVFAVVSRGTTPDRAALLAAAQAAVRGELNPLFKVHDLVLVASLPRTASNKLLRRALRDSYQPGPPPGPLP